MISSESVAGNTRASVLGADEQDPVFLRDQAAWVIAANQDLSERLVVARGERRAIEARASVAEHEAAKLRQENHLLQIRLTQVETQLDSLKRRHRIVVESLLFDGALLKLGEILIKAGAITNEDLEQALREQGSARDKLLGAILVADGRVGEEEVAQAVACQFNVPMLSIDLDYMDTGVVWRVGEKVCRDYRCVPIRSAGGRVLVAMANPGDAGAQEILGAASGCKVVPFVATPSDIELAIREMFKSV